ncbi:MAG: hypothetical protein ASARMPRED_009197 [Alectoria sarmentosa]|nr:MAG: hypothetical protein ASARMPRED_009197 [Alectoria sarmentosa]
MAATVTLDKVYFETLLRRAEFVRHLLRDSLYKGGIDTETLEVLIRGEAIPVSQAGTFTGDGDEPASAGMDLYHRHQKTQTTMSRPSGHSWADAVPEWPPKGSAGGNLKGKGGFINHHNNFALEDDSAFTPDFEKDDPYLAAPQPERKRFAKMEQRTIFAKNLSDRATHKDVVDFARGGLILDIYLRSHERSASISFVEGSAAQDFMNHVKRNDIYVHGKRLEFTWSERQYNLPGHVGNKISIGATRNVVIRGIHPNITEERIREDLLHIHNIVVISVSFENGDAYISLNSINNSLFARTCMMSRVTYKGMKIEWYPDECAQPLPKTQYAPKKENLAPSQPKKFTSAMNRFQMLNLDNDGTEDDSEETDEEPAVLSDLSSMYISSHRSPWNPRTVAA